MDSAFEAESIYAPLLLPRTFLLIVVKCVRAVIRVAQLK